MAENKKPEKEINATTAVKKEATDAIQQEVSADNSGTPATQSNAEDKTDSKTSTRRRKSDKKRRSTKRGREGRERSEFEQRIIGIRRVTRVVAGGRRFSFSVAMVVGDGKGRVGVGLGKSTDTSLAIEKAARDAKKNMIKVSFNDNMSLDHELTAKFKASIVEIRPAPGRGLVAGSSVRDVLELAGARDVSAKLQSRSKNKINNARCAIKALQPISKKARVEESRPAARGRGRRS